MLKDTAIGGASHAEGDECVTYGYASHAQNTFTTADVDYSTAIGIGNKKMNSGDLFVIGNGTLNENNVFYLTNRSNAFRVTNKGATYGLSAFNTTGADYSEFFEWLDGNINNGATRL